MSSHVIFLPTWNRSNDVQNSSAHGFHYVLSKAQEDEIREAFLIEKLKNYTQVSTIAPTAKLVIESIEELVF